MQVKYTNQLQKAVWHGGHGGRQLYAAPPCMALLHVTVPLRCMFEGPTVAQPCRAVAEREVRPGQTEKTAAILKRVQLMEGADVPKTLRGKVRDERG